MPIDFNSLEISDDDYEGLKRDMKDNFGEELVDSEREKLIIISENVKTKWQLLCFFRKNYPDNWFFLFVIHAL